MTQYATPRSMSRTIPGHILTPEGPGRETESIVVPHVMQTITLTFGGASPLAAGNYVTTFITPNFGTIAITLNSDGTKTFAAGTVELDSLIEANGDLANMFSVTNNGTTTATLTARAATTSIAVPITVVPGADTLTAAQSVAASSASLRLGVFYVHGTTTSLGVIINTPRGCRIGVLPTIATVVGDLRGIVARTANQSTPTSNDPATAGNPDTYRAGQVGYGCLRGTACVVVDPASATISALTDPIFVVIAAGAFSIVGSVTSSADGANTIQLNNTTPVRARVVAREETISFGANTGRCVVLKVNQTN